MKKLIVILICCTALVGCKTSSNTPKTKPDGKIAATASFAPPMNSKLEDFDKFYDRFHSDSAFQLSRVKFPLKGGYHTVDNSSKWTPANWHIMTTRVYDVDKNKYKATYSKTENTFTQKVWIDSAGFYTECRFELIDGKWFLVYMNDENK